MALWDANLIARVAAAMYESPDPEWPDAPRDTWPPQHPADFARWVSYAKAALGALLEPPKGGMSDECWDDREELIKVIDQAADAPLTPEFVRTRLTVWIADAVLAAGFRRADSAVHDG